MLDSADIYSIMIYMRSEGESGESRDHPIKSGEENEAGGPSKKLDCLYSLLILITMYPWAGLVSAVSFEMLEYELVKLSHDQLGR